MGELSNRTIKTVFWDCDVCGVEASFTRAPGDEIPSAPAGWSWLNRPAIRWGEPSDRLVCSRACAEVLIAEDLRTLFDLAPVPV